jgi:hypothetical protein
MAETAYKTIYRDEWIKAFERDKTTLRETCTREMMSSGRQAVFLVAGSGSEATTRGANGLIPATPLDLNQSTVTLTESHSLKNLTNFNIFAGQSNQRAIMQDMTRSEINRSIDNKIITALATGTVDANATAQIMSKSLVTHATTLLWNAKVPNDGNVYGLATPAAWGHLSDNEEFGEQTWVGKFPLVDGTPAMGASWVVWQGVKWAMHTGLPNMGLSTAQCIIYHKNAIGYGSNAAEIMASADYNDEQDYSWARATTYDQALKLQNSGIVIINHDDSIYSASS